LLRIILSISSSILIEAEIAVARDAGMPELEAYAVELRTAVYRGLHASRGLLV